MRVGDCPSCRAPVEFETGGGKVKVCAYCHTVVLRGDANLEDLGKVADLVDTNSPLRLGLGGRYSGTPFTVCGRIQKRNRTGTWDEWCLAFEDGRTGWLSESEGEWNFMFPLEGVELPPAERLRPLFEFSLRGKRFVVEERNRATTFAAEGQLPEFNREHLYADCTGPKGVFASLDYGDGHGEAFVGNRVTLAQMGFDPNELEPTPRRDALSAARCTECNGPLELKAPDATKRVGCPYCGALLEVSHGQLAFLQLLEKPAKGPTIALGTVGTLGGVRWTVLAYLVRSCNVEGTRYPWDEYLLWNQEKGFTWLMQSNGHWTWLQPVAAGTVDVRIRSAVHEGVEYKAYQRVFACTDYVVGECYWTVSVGDLAKATEYVAPPYSLNQDETDDEVTFTRGELLPPEAVEAAFGLKAKLPRPTSIASAQSNPFKQRAASAWKWAGFYAVVLLALVVYFAATGRTTQYLDATFDVRPGAAPASPEAQRFSERFDIPAETPLVVRIDAPRLDNNWLGVSVDLVHETTGEVVSVYAETERYSGYEDGTSWTEGSQSTSVQTSEVDPGTYVVRVTPHFDPGRAIDYRVRVEADGGVGFCGPCFFFVLLFLLPLYNQVRSGSFETERWSESVFQSSPSASEGTGTGRGRDEGEGDDGDDNEDDDESGRDDA